MYIQAVLEQLKPRRKQRPHLQVSRFFHEPVTLLGGVRGFWGLHDGTCWESEISIVKSVHKACGSFRILVGVYTGCPFLGQKRLLHMVP